MDITPIFLCLGILCFSILAFLNYRLVRVIKEKSPEIYVKVENDSTCKFLEQGKTPILMTYILLGQYRNLNDRKLVILCHFSRVFQVGAIISWVMFFITV